MSRYFECCRECKPPQRYPGCHAKCKEYLKAKEAWDKVRQVERKCCEQENIFWGSHRRK